MTVWSGCPLPPSVDVAADFRSEFALGARPAGWTAVGDDAASSSIWQVEHLGAGQPNDVRPTPTENGRRNALLAPPGPESAMGRIVVTFKHFQLRFGFAESSGGLGICVRSRGTGAHPSGFFLRGGVNVNSGAFSLVPEWRGTDGVLHLPGPLYGVVLPSLTPHTSISVEMERTAVDALRWRAFRTQDAPGAWAYAVIGVELQGLVGRPALFYMHNNGNNIGNARFETLEYTGVSELWSDCPIPAASVWFAQ